MVDNKTIEVVIDYTCMILCCLTSPHVHPVNAYLTHDIFEITGYYVPGGIISIILYHIAIGVIVHNVTDGRYPYFTKTCVIMCLVSLITFMGILMTYHSKKHTVPSVGMALKCAWLLTALNVVIWVSTAIAV